VRASLENEIVVQALLKNTGLTLEELKYAVTDGQGPVLRLKDLNTDINSTQQIFGKYEPGSTSTFSNMNAVNNGEYKNEVLKKDVINIDIKTFLSRGYLSGNQNSPHMFYLAMTILHELVHYGDNHFDGIANNAGDKITDDNERQTLIDLAVANNYPPIIEAGFIFENNLFQGVISQKNSKYFYNRLIKETRARDNREAKENGKNPNLKSPRNM
jgi:hypothetical protein